MLDESGSFFRAPQMPFEPTMTPLARERVHTKENNKNGACA